MADLWKSLPWYLKVAVAAAAAAGLREAWARLNEKNLKGEVVVLTGAGSGIGRLMALRLAKAGCKLALWDISKQGVEAVAEEARGLGAEVETYVADVSDREAVYACGDLVKERFGQVDILINNAGIVHGKKFLDVPDAAAEKVMQVNAIAHFWTVKAFLPGMIQRNHGHVVTIASAAGRSGVAGLADYCASKHAAVGFDEALRQEFQRLGLSGLHTTCVCPYYINTGMFDGVKTRFSWLLPILEPNYAADSIIQAIRRNDPVLCMPRIVYTVPLLRGLLPVAVTDWVSHFLGISASMDEFKGRAVTDKDAAAKGGAAGAGAGAGAGAK